MTVRLLHGDCRAVLPRLPDASVHCIVTSPPYYGLRDYGCEGQIGLEQTPDAYVAELVAVFREARRVLRDDGTFWLNLGDSYAGAPIGSFNGGGFKDVSAQTGGRDLSGVRTSGQMNKLKASGLKPKDLIGIPWRVAFALQADGWFLRQDIIWSKPNPMPESVTDRCTKAHEYMFLLSKSSRYWYDAKAISENALSDKGSGNKERKVRREHGGNSNHGGAQAFGVPWAGNDRNRRSVWTIASQPYTGAHFATMPPELAELCIKAGTSERGCCPTCMVPWVRMLTKSTGGKRTWHDHSDDLGSGQSQCKHGQAAWETYTPRQTLGWSPSCACPKHTPRPCTVLDPFAGAGTTGLVADRLGRDAVLIELNPQYSDLGRSRLEDDAGMFAQIAEADLRPA